MIDNYYTVKLFWARSKKHLGLLRKLQKINNLKMINNDVQFNELYTYLAMDRKLIAYWSPWL